MRRREFITLLSGASTWPLAAWAQQSTIPTIGVLQIGTPTSYDLSGFRQGLKEAGYVEGQNLKIEYRFANDDPAHLPELAADLVGRKVNVIAAVASALAARAARMQPIPFRSFLATTPCWNETAWSDEDPGCFKEPTERTPLTLIINEDMEPLREYKRALTKRMTEVEVERRVTKYTSHIAYHLYQMYQASQGRRDENPDETDARRREEIRRVAMTLIKLMEISR
jgi:hypothetical protein